MHAPGRTRRQCLTPRTCLQSLPAAAGGLLLLGLLALPSRAGSPAPPPPSRPNILFIFSDDHGAQTISAYGSYRNRTPALDRLADEGMRFENCFCTNSICAPSRATILTGKHTHTTGHTTNERIFDNRLETFPELLKKAGYQTALIGKWHLNTEPVGFDTWDILINQGVYYNPPMIRNGKYLQRAGYTTDIITDLTIDWLRKERDPARPFLLLSHHKAPHRGWDPALRHLSLYEQDSIPEPPTLFDDWRSRSSAWSHAEMSIARHLWPGDLHLEIPSWQMNPGQKAVWDSVYGPRNRAFENARLAGIPLIRWKYQRYAKDYLRTVAAMDEGIGRLLAYLDSSGLAGTTMVIYSSDQGWYLGEHGMFDKRWMYEESFRMPLIVRWPGVVRPGAVNTSLVQNLDFAQTLLEAAGVASPRDMQGRSFLPLLKGEKPADWRTSVYYHFYESDGAHRVPRHYGVRTDRYKLIHFYQLGQWELFNLARDSLELENVYGKPEYLPVQETLTRELARLQQEYRVTPEADSISTRLYAQLNARWKFLALLGKVPSRFGVKIDTLGVRAMDGYRREHIAYSVGTRRVEAYVLVPTASAGRLMPGILAVHPGGAAGTPGKKLSAGETGPADLAYGLELCRQGFVVICPDRPGYGSRLLPRGASLEAEAERLVAEGSSLLGQEITELWVAASYLATRGDVHSMRVGVIGQGEGGLLATLLASLNEEIAAAVSLDGLRPFRELFAGTPRPPRKEERHLLLVPGILSWGEIDDAVAGIFPRPYLALQTAAPEADGAPGRSPGSAAGAGTLFALAERRYGELDHLAALAHRTLTRTGKVSRTPATRQEPGSAPDLRMRREAYDWLDRWLKW